MMSTPDRRRRTGIGAPLVLACATFALVGCAETQLGAQLAKNVARAGAAPAAAPQPAQSTDPALAPDAFDTTGLTIWDGAVTLQGVWLAHPLAQRAQRVRVTNLETGLRIEGAMFRRDPTLSGPSILVSSDAARGLGLTPGAPTELKIVALREGPVADAPQTQSAGAQDESAVETASLAPPESAAPETATPETVDDVEVAAPPPIEDDVPAEPAAEAPAEPPAAAQPVESPPSTAAETDDPQPADPQSEAAAPPETTTAEVTNDAGEAPPPAAAPARTGDFLQVGSFSVEANAEKLVGRLNAKGQPARYVNRDIGGKTFSIVVVGPLATPEAEAAARKAVAEEGIGDAIKVTL